MAKIPDDEPALLLVESQEAEKVNMLINEECVWPNLNQGDKGKWVKSKLWYLDNGSSNNMTGGRSKFDKLDESIVGQVKFGDGSVVQIKGKGSITLRCTNGGDRQLKEV